MCFVDGPDGTGHGVGDRVVAGVGSGESEVGDGDGLSGAGGLGVVGADGVGDGDGIADDDAVEGIIAVGEGRHRGAVVGLGDGCR